MHLGRDRVICCFHDEQRGLLVDPGPGSTLQTLLEALDGAEPRALLLTHIHLDHAGASGALCERFPDLQVYVHEIGAPHMVDPEKLLESAGRLYGEDMDRLWGSMEPVPEDRIHTLEGGETVEGHRVAYTPGHAWHHVSYLDEDSGHAYTGDVAGVRVPPHEYTLAPTPPPEIDVEAWMKSLDTVGEWRPEAVCLTHFGRFDDAAEQLDRARAALRDEADHARELDPEAFAEWIEGRTREAVDADAAESLVQAAPPDQLGQGLARYWSKREDAA
jgi:glyoxylase-like metal-dependent hydrolase (beta-lactamase superfamily II)